MRSSAFLSQHDLVRPMLRHKRAAATFFLSTLTLAAGGLSLCPQKYESEAKLFVRIGRENTALDPTATTGQFITLNASRETEINSIVEHLSSRCIIENTLDRIDPVMATAPSQVRETAIKTLSKSLSFESPRKSAIVSVRCRARSPEEAQHTASAVVDVYLDEHMRINRTSGSFEFFTEQAQLIQSQLDHAQTLLRDAKNRSGFSSIDNRRRALEDQVSALEIQIRQAAAALSASNAKIAALGGSLRHLPQALASQLVGGTPNDGLANMREELFTLRTREKELLSKCTSQHPLAIAVCDAVQEAETALKAEQPDHEQTVIAVLAAETANRDALFAQQQTLTEQLVELRLRLADLNEHEVLINQLSREVEQLESKYLLYVGNSEQARVDLALQTDRISNVSILQAPSFMPNPVSPAKALVLALALVFGSCGGVGSAFLLEQLQRPPARRREPAARTTIPAHHEVGTVLPELPALC